MSDCKFCKMQLEKNWLFCPFCGSLISAEGRPDASGPDSEYHWSPPKPGAPSSADSLYVRSPRAGSKDARASGKGPPTQDSRSSREFGAYGVGVRAQVFEVIVRQGIAGAPWREICAGPMQVNNISADDIQEEIDRRLGDGGMQTARVPKKPRSPFGEWFDSLKNPNPSHD